MFCQVNEFVTPLLLALVIMNVICVEVTDPTATVAGSVTPLMFLLVPPLPPMRLIKTVGAVPPVSKLKPEGALRMIVPVPALPLVDSE
jgi:hypothetical protein